MAKHRYQAKKTPAPKLSESNWQAREDMHTLARAHEVKSDPKRHAAAKEHARGEADKMRKVAGRKS